MSVETPAVRGKLQRAILELLARTEAEQEDQLGSGMRFYRASVQYRYVAEVVRDLYVSLRLPLGPGEDPPHAFDVAVRRAMRSLATRGDVVMARVFRYGPNGRTRRSSRHWACWLAGQEGFHFEDKGSQKSTDAAEMRRAILEHLQATEPNNPQYGHYYVDVLEAVGSRLGLTKQNSCLSVTFCRAVGRLREEGHIVTFVERYDGGPKHGRISGRLIKLVVAW